MHPTGKPVMITGFNVDRVVEGRIVEHGGAANMFGALLEIGAINAVGPARVERKVTPGRRNGWRRNAVCEENEAVQKQGYPEAKA
jgi:hypothetical protein